MTANTAPEATEAQLMFVQSAHGLTTNDGSITLHGVAHSTLFFADRPERVVGHLKSRDFVNQWGEGEDSFASDPPNAVVSFLEPGDEIPEEVTVVLQDPTLHENELTYKVDILDGKLPATSGPCAVFIDPIGRPLSPMSIAGVRRRQMRRAVRRR